MLKKILLSVFAICCITMGLQAQETNSSMQGLVKNANGDPLVGATVKATHLPTGTVFQTTSRASGRFDLNNMQPGGPYTVEVTFVGFDVEKRENVFLTLGEKGTYDFALITKGGALTEVVITARNFASKSGIGVETNIGRDKIANVPTVSRSINDFVRLTPQAKITGDGGISIAGQNNRFNAFFIDGAINNDVFGLAASGTNGGQANTNPISIDAIDQFQVVLSPFDASLGGFTGGGINATTLSGTNELHGAVWGYYRNENLAGKTPGNVDKANRTKLSKLTNKIGGFKVGGPLIKNKLFFFVLGETESQIRPQPYDFSGYRGNATKANIDNLVSFVKTTYGYDMGSYLDNPESLEARRITTKLDWNISNNHKLSLSYRFNEGNRENTASSSNTSINFFNNGIFFPSKANTFTAELKSSFKKGASNRLLVTYTNVLDNRDPIGSPFPRVTINDGSGRLTFGSENFSTGNYLAQKNFTINDAFKFTVGKNQFSIGTDNLISKANNLFIRDLWGSYTYSTLNDFLTNARPSQYSHTYSAVELNNTNETNSKSAAIFNYVNLAFYLNDEIRATDKLTLNFGIRADKTIFNTDPTEDPVFNTTVIPAIVAAGYDLKGARSGQIAKVPWSISPRAGFTYRIPDEKLTIRGGAGFFTGRMPLVWPGGVYNNTGINLASVTQTTGNFGTTGYTGFRADPFNQYLPSDLGATASSAKGQVDLMAAEFKLPRLFRTSLSIEKKLNNNWKATLEGLFSKNINEPYYQNVNILKPTLTSVGPGARTVYSFSGTPSRLSLPGGNPYGANDIYVLYNNDNDKRGFSYNFTAGIEKAFSKGFTFNASYTYGNSVVNNENTSSQNNSQWRFMETVNGRNAVGRSTSDFDLGHRIFSYLSKKFSYANDKLATTVTLTYNGQQGSPYSYVYSASMVGDRSRSETNDLIYIPTASELQSQTFVSNTTGGVTYTPQQQKDLLERYIAGNKYLSKTRGKFADRNGDRLPFTHLLDLSLRQDFNLKVSGKQYTIQLTYDVYNFTNMLNKDWGRTYFLSNDNYALIQFAGYTSAANLTPTYRFNPQSGKPWNLSTSTAPGLSARWLSQVGLRIIF